MERLNEVNLRQRQLKDIVTVEHFKYLFASIIFAAVLPRLYRQMSALFLQCKFCAAIESFLHIVSLIPIEFS